MALSTTKWQGANFFVYGIFQANSRFKNDSTIEGYNLHASGQGGICADLLAPNADSNWCSTNASFGGWEGVDQECATMGRLQIPVSMSYNWSHLIGKRWMDGISMEM